MLTKSRSHLRSAGETYFQHMRFASAVGAMTIAAGLACLIHALVPALCEKTCSRTVALLQQLFRNRDELPHVASQASGAITFVGLLTLASLVTAITLLAGGLQWLALAMAALAYAIPVAFLLGNPDLESVDAET